MPSQNREVRFAAGDRNTGAETQRFPLSIGKLNCISQYGHRKGMFSMRSIGHLIKNKFLRKMGALYLCIFLLPTMMISMFVLRYTMNQFGERLLNQQALVSANSMARLEKWSETCQAIITQLSSYDVLRNDLSMYSNQVKLQQALHQLTVAHNGLKYIWYYIPDSACLLSGSDSLTTARLENGRYAFPDVFSEKTALESLQDGQSIRAYDRYINSSCILLPYSFNFSQASRLRKHLIIFQISQEYLNQELQNTLGTAIGAISLYDASHNLLASFQQDMELSCFPSEMSLNPLNISTCHVYGRFWLDGDHLQLAIKTPGQRWTMLGLYQDTSGTATMFSIQQLLMLLFASLFALGMIAVIVIIYKLYMPVHSIRTAAAQTGWQKTTEVIDDDYEYIESCIDHIAIDNATLKDTLRDHRQRNRAMVSSLLFEGRVRNPEELNALYDGCNFHPVGSQYWILALLCSQEARQHYCQHHAEEEHSPLVMSFQDGCLLLYFEEAPKSSAFLQDGIKTMRQIQADELSAIPLHCAEVLLMLSCGQESPEHVLPEECVEMLDLAQKGKNTAVLRTWYANAEHESPLEAVRALAWLTLFACKSLDQGRMEVPEWFYLPDSLPPAVCKERSQRFLELMEAWLAAVPDENANDFELMKAYISAQFDSPSFSIKKMAQDFSMSISSLSSFFKRHAGVLLSDYIAEMKMEKAKFLLKKTSMSINDISLSVGYYNVNSFIRRFQQRISISPREYRSAKE